MYNVTCKQWQVFTSNLHLILKDTCTPIFTVALFTITKIWKQPKCPAEKKDKEDVVYIESGILFNYTKHKILPFAATWINLEIIILSEVSQRKTTIWWYHLYVKSKKNDANELIYKTEIDLLA